jgi:hypothetical protein
VRLMLALGAQVEQALEISRPRCMPIQHLTYEQQEPEPKNSEWLKPK